MKGISIVTCFILLFFGLIISCSKRGSIGGSVMNGGGAGGGGGTTLNCTGVPKSFSADVNPIIQSFCNVSGCHNNGSTNGPGPLTNYPQVSAAASTIRTVIITGVMPQNATLSTAQKNSIVCWIDSGAQDN